MEYRAATRLTLAVVLALGPFGSIAFPTGALYAQSPAEARSEGGVGSALQGAEWGRAVASFADSLSAQVAADGVGGIAAGVVVDGDLVWARGFGWADRDRRAPMAPAAVSRTGSISKSVTGLLLMRLVDQGVVGLDDPVERHLPEFATVQGRREGWPAVTLRMLASHTAGLEREPSDVQAMVSGPIEVWEQRVVESLAQTSFDSIPGARYQYSNIGFGALGLALSRAAGRPFRELVQAEIFDPLGMTGSAFVVVGAELEPRLATGYVNREDGSIDADRPWQEHRGRGYKVPNGGVYSTVADLGRFLGAVTGVPGLRILSEESRRTMIAVQTPESTEEGYGIGLSVVRPSEALSIVGHGGSVAGYTAYMATSPETGVGVILLRNYQRGATNLGAAARSLVEELSGLDGGR